MLRCTSRCHLLASALTFGGLLSLALTAHAQAPAPPAQPPTAVAPPPLTPQQAQAKDWQAKGDQAVQTDATNAIACYRKAVELDPTQLLYVMRLGQTYALVGVFSNPKLIASLKATGTAVPTIKMPMEAELPSPGIALQELAEAKIKVFLAPDEQTQLRTLLNSAAGLLSIQADTELDRSNYSNVVELYTRSLDLARRMGNTEVELESLNGLGLVYGDLGQHERAAATYKLELQRQADPKTNGEVGSRAMTLNNLGWCYDSMGQSKIALDYYQQALELEGRLPHTNDAMFTLVGINSEALQSYTIGNIGLAYYRLQQRPQGIIYGQQALALAQKVKDRDVEGKILSWLGWGYAHNGQNPEALQALNQSLTVNRATGNRAAEAFTLSTLMLVWQNMKQPAVAILYGKQAINAYQDIRLSARRLDKDLQKSLLQSHEATYRQLADLLMGRGRLPEAQQVLNLLKQEEFFDFVRRDAADTEGLKGRATLTPQEAAQQARYQTIADQVTQLGARQGELLAKETRTAEEETELTKLQADLDTANAQFQSYLDALSTQFANTAQKGRIEQIADAQSLQSTLGDLGQGSVALYTLVGEDKYRVILVTPETQVAAEYPITAAELNRKVLAYRQTLQDPSLDPRPQSQELYKILIAPIAKALAGAKAQTLMWSLDGTLRYLPMSTLYDGKQYLIEKYRSTVFTPASNANLKDEPTAKWKALGLGVSKPQPGFNALPGVVTELKGIINSTNAVGTTTTGGVLPGTVEMDETFTADSLKTALRQKYPLVHIASHFAFQPGNETNSFLLLGDGTHFTLDQIKTLSFRNVDLLTLSACDTATGGVDADGKEVESFGVLAQRQGARAVMATLWPVSDESTQYLMREFYRLREAAPDTSKAEALRDAQLALLRGTAQVANDGTTRGNRGATLATQKANDAPQAPPFKTDPKAPFAHPYFWAPFILIGNWK